MTKEELKAEIERVDYYIQSNIERGNMERVKELKKYKQKIK